MEYFNFVSTNVNFSSFIDTERDIALEILNIAFKEKNQIPGVKMALIIRPGP